MGTRIHICPRDKGVAQQVLGPMSPSGFFVPGPCVIPGVWISRNGNFTTPPNAVEVVQTWLDHLSVPYYVVDKRPTIPQIDPTNPDQVRLVLERVPELAAKRADDLMDTMRDYQKEALCWSLPRSGSLLFLPPGSGKTLVYILWGLMGRERKTFVLVTLAQVKYHVAAEFQKWAGFEPYVCEGKSPKPLAVGTRAIVINYEILPHWIEHILAIGPYASAYDESVRVGRHGKRFKKIENEDASVSFKRLKNVASACALLSENTTRRMAGTGTPHQDRTRDWWAQLDILEPKEWGRMVSYYEYDGQKNRVRLMDDVTNTPLIASFGFGPRYCLEPTTRLLMTDCSWRPIGELAIGDEVMGWGAREPGATGGQGHRVFKPAKVQRIWNRDAECVRVTLESGSEVICTPDHSWLNSKLSRRNDPTTGQAEHGPFYRQLIDPDSKDPRHKEMRRLLRLTPSPTEHEETVEYRIGYLRGLADGDGHIVYAKQHAKSYFKKVTEAVVISGKDLPHLERALRYAKELGLVNGQKQLYRRKDADLHQLHMTSGAAKALLTKTRGVSREYMRGWLAGFYDAEGSYETISQYREKNPGPYRYCCDALSAFGFDFAEEEKAVRLRGGRVELIRFYALANIALTRKVRSALFRKKHAHANVAEPDRIVSIEPVGVWPVVSIQTKTGNYIAEGYGSKNCNGWQGEWGWQLDGSSFENEFNARKATLTFHRTADQISDALRKAGVTMTRDIRVVTLDLQNRNIGYAKEIKQAAKNRNKPKLAQLRLEEAASRKHKYAVDLIMESLKVGHKVVVFHGRRKACDKLGEMVGKAIEKENIKKRVRVTVDGEEIVRETTEPCPLWIGHGDHLAKARHEMGTAYMATEGPACLIGTGYAWGTGVELHDTDTVLMVMLPWSPGDVEQWEHRFIGPTRIPKRSVRVLWLIARGTADERIQEALIDKLPAVEKTTGNKEAGEVMRQLRGDDRREEILASLVADLIAEDA